MKFPTGFKIVWAKASKLLKSIVNFTNLLMFSKIWRGTWPHYNFIGKGPHALNLLKYIKLADHTNFVIFKIMKI